MTGRVDGDGVAKHHAQFGISLEQIDRFLHCTRQEQVVGVQPGDIFSMGVPEAFIDGFRLAAVGSDAHQSML